MEAIEAQIELWLKQDVTEKCDASPYNSLLVCAKKKNGALRLCIDYRAINKHTINESQFVPQPEDLLNKVGTAKPRFISTTDVAQGYLNIEIEEEDRHKTAFTTNTGRYQFKRMCYGLSGSSFSFIKMMLEVLEPLKGAPVLAYIDDCIIYDNEWEEHMGNLRNFLRRIKECGLSLKIEKARLAYQSVEFLGHIISNEGLKMDPEKVVKALKFPRPTTVKET